MKINKKIYALFFFALLFLGSCTKSCKKTEEGSSQINIAVGFPIEGLDPRYTTSAVSSRVSKLIYAPLFELGADLAPEPFLAESFEQLDDKTYKVVLRDGLSFHDGSPLSAQDVVYTFKELNSKDVASPHAEKFHYLESISAASEREIIFKLNQVFAPFLTDLCALAIVSKKSCENRSQECRHENNGSGPFKVKNWDTSKEALLLEPFANWFEGSPKNSLNIRVVRDENTRLLELIAKKTDLIESDISPQNTLELKKQAHLKIEEIYGLGYFYLALNQRGPDGSEKKDSQAFLAKKALATKEVRQAIAHAIDFDQIIEKILLNSAKRVSGLIPNNHWAKDANLKPPAFDPVLAEKLLDEAGFKRLGKEQVRFAISISTTPNRMRQSIAQLYADYLSKVGIKTEIRVKEWGALYQDMKQGNFEMFSASWVPVTDPDLYYYVHHSESIPDELGNGGNRHGYKNPMVDKLIEEGRTMTDPIKRRDIYTQIERILLEDLPYIPLWNENRIIISNKERLQNFIAHPSGSLLGLRKAYIGEPEKRASL